jgi:hypothetical protein
MKTVRTLILFLGVFSIMFLASNSGSVGLTSPLPQMEPILDLPPDPEGESGATVNLTNTSGDPSGTMSAGYMLDDGAIVVNFAGVGSGSQSATYQIDVDEFSNSYSITNTGTQDIPPCIAASVRLSTVRKSNNTEQVRTIDRLTWRIVGSTVGFTSWADLYAAINGGGLTWNIVKSPVDPPYTTSPFNQNLINDTGNGKYKNLNFGDPSLSTIAVHFIRIQKDWAGNPLEFRFQSSHKIKGEGIKKFKGEVRTNQDLLPGC